MLSHKNKITFWCHLIHQVNEYLKSFHEKIVLFKNRKQTTKRMNLLCQGKNANKQIKTDWFVFFSVMKTWCYKEMITMEIYLPPPNKGLLAVIKLLPNVAVNLGRYHTANKTTEPSPLTFSF